MTLSQIIAKIKQFNRARQWERYHTPKNLILAIVRELGELIECFRWKPDIPVKEQREREEIASEIADIFIYLATLAYELEIDLEDAVLRKIDMNEKRFPVPQS